MGGALHVRVVCCVCVWAYQLTVRKHHDSPRSSHPNEHRQHEREAVEKELAALAELRANAERELEL